MSVRAERDIDYLPLRPSALKPSPESRAKWEKVLWRRQPFPDNYVPPSFLSELKTLPPRTEPRFSSLFTAALPVSQHLAVIALFLAVFHQLLVGDLGAGEVGWTCVLLGLVGYFVRKWGWGQVQTTRSDVTLHLLPPPTPLRPLILPPLLLSLLSPVLGTLTSATTSDSIWPLAGGLFFVHLLLADFTTGQDARLKQRERKRRQERKRRGSVSRVEPLSDEKSLTSSLSLTSALSASIVLASRLPSTAHVFSFVFLAVGLFAGWPAVAKGVREAGKIFSLTLTVSMLFLAISLFPTDPFGPTLVFLSIIALVNVLGPAMLLFAWRWKTHRGGVWDVAIVKLNRKAEGRK